MTQQFHSLYLEGTLIAHTRIILSSLLVVLKNYKQSAVKTLRVQIKLQYSHNTKNNVETKKKDKTQI